METQITTKELFSKESIQNRFKDILGKKAPGFISSVLQEVNNNKLLKAADPNTIIYAAATAACLDLPINSNLGFAWIVPYKNQAQFQMGWKGFVQLALRTGQYKRINVTDVYENQYKSFNKLTEELIADFNLVGQGGIVGYASYFRLVNGMEKTTYWSKEEVIKHAKKYSKAFGSNYSPWSDKDQFHAMAKKTVLKNAISKWGIMSIEMQTAQIADQSVQEDEGDYKYIDNNGIDVKLISENNETKRIKNYINNSKDIKQLNAVKRTMSDELKVKFEKEIENKENQLNKESKLNLTQLKTN